MINLMIRFRFLKCNEIGPTAFIKKGAESPD